MVTYDTPLHEFMHPILLAMQHQYLGRTILTKARQERLDNTELYQAIKAAYPELTDEELEFEIGATILGFVSEEKVARILHDQPKTTWNRLKDFVKDTWNNVKTLMYDLFQVRNMRHEANYAEVRKFNPIQMNRKPISYETDATFMDVANHLVDMALNGELNGMLDEVELQQVAVANRTWESKLINPIQSVRDNAQALLLGESLKQQDIDKLEDEQYINNIYNRMVSSGESKVTLGFDSVDLSEEFKIVDRDKRRSACIERLYKDFLPLVKSQNDTLKDKINQAIKGAGMSAAEIQEIFTVEAAGKKMVMISPNNIARMANMMDINKNLGGRIIRYSDLQKMTVNHPDLAKALTDTFKGYDPYIVIHNQGMDKNGKIVYDLSIFDIHIGSLNFRGRGLSKGALLTNNFVPDRVAKREGVSYGASVRGVHKLNLGLLSMKLKRSMPAGTIKIRRTSVFEVTPFSGRKDEYGKVMNSPVSMEEIIPIVNVLAGSDYNNQIPEELRSVLNDADLTDINIYQPDYLDMVNSWWMDLREGMEGDPRYEGYEERMDTNLKEIQNYLETGNYTGLLRVIRARQEWLVSQYGLKNNDERATNVEYRMLSQLAMELTNYVQTNDMKSQNAVQTLILTQYDLKNPLIQNYTARQGIAFAKIVEQFKTFTRELDQKTEQFIKDGNVNPNLAKKILSDPSNDYFRRLFITEVVDGQEVNVGRLHWDKNDPRTRKALNDNQITLKDLEYTNYILDAVERNLKGLIKQNMKSNPQYMNEDGTTDTGKINEKADQDFRSNWTRGMVPVMYNSVTQMLGNKNQIGMAFKKMLNQAVYQQDIFDDMIQISANHDDLDTIHSLFYGQVANVNNPEYGGEQRVKMMGLQINDGVVSVEDKRTNEALSYNLYTMMKYLSMDNIQKKVIEDEVLPAWNDAVIVAKAHEIFKNRDMSEVIKYLELNKSKNVTGRHEVEDKQDKVLHNASAAANAVLRVTSIAGVAWNLSVAITSLVANQYEITSNAMANKTGNAYDMATPTQTMRAMKEVTGNFKKVKAIEDLYQIIEQDRSSVINNQKYDKTRSQMWNDNVSQAGNRLGDIFYRRVAFVAQMIHDGTWDAHDNQGHYDYKKDPRFTKGNKENEVKYDFLKQDLQNEGVLEKGKEANRAYSYKEQTKLRMVGTEFGVGVFDKESKSVGDNYLWYRVLFQFKNFMNSVLQTRLGSKFSSLEGGHWEITKDKDGKLMQDEFGKYIREWKALEREGSWTTTASLAGSALANMPFVAKMMDNLHLSIKPRSLEDFKHLSDLEKHNLAKTGMDAMTFITVMILSNLYDQMLKGLDPDDKKWAQKNLRLKRAMENGLLTSIAASPGALFDTFTSVAMVSTLQRLLNIATFTNPLKELTYLTPGASTVKVISDYATE